MLLLLTNVLDFYLIDAELFVSNYFDIATLHEIPLSFVRCLRAMLKNKTIKKTINL